MLSYKTKNIIKVIILFLAISGLIFIVLSVAFKGSPKIQETPKNEPLTTANESFPTSGVFSGSRRTPPKDQNTLSASPVANGGLTLTTQLTSAPIISPTLINGKDVAFYDKRDGKFYTIDSEGNIVQLSDKVFPQAKTIEFNATSKKAAIEFPDGSNIIYDFETDVQTTLPSQWEELKFTNQGEQLAAKSIGNSPENNALLIAENDGSRTKAITGMGSNSDKVTINWSPNNSIVAFSSTGRAQSTFGRKQVYVIDQNGEAPSSLIVEGDNFSAVWSPDGSHILYSVANVLNYNAPLLYFVKASGSNAGSDKRPIPLSTWAEKCTFKDKVMAYCAVPKEIPKGALYKSDLITTGDDLYQINVVNGVIRLIATPATKQRMFNLKISDDEKTLFYTDKLGRLNRMKLQ